MYKINTVNEMVRKLFNEELNLEKFNQYRYPEFVLPFYFEDEEILTLDDWNNYFKNLNCNQFIVVCKYFGLLNFSNGLNQYEVKNYSNWYGSTIKNPIIKDLFESKIKECNIENLTPKNVRGAI